MGAKYGGVSRGWLYGGRGLNGILPRVTEAEPGLYGTPGRVEQEVATVQAIYTAFARRDVEAALPHVADDCEMHVPGTAALTGRTGPYRGPEGVREYFADAARVWTELTLHAEDIRASSGGVVVFGHAEGRVGDELVRRRVLWLWQVRDGKAVHVRANDLGDDNPA
jgi:ketosteroid isomerase-like protein